MKHPGEQRKTLLESGRGKCRLALFITGLALLAVGEATASEGWSWQEGLSADVRLRWEAAEMDGLEGSDAVTARARIGLESPDLEGLRFFVEAEYTESGKTSSYDAYPGAQGQAGKTVIADPRNLEINRLQASYQIESFGMTVGRQRIIRNNARFIGNVGWRQNEQTFDAVFIKWNPDEAVEWVYGYIDRANRIFGKYADAESQRYFEMASHIVEVRYSGLKDLEGGLYGYLLRMENSPGAASDTLGAWLAGNHGLQDGLGFTWRAELARQSDNHRSPDGADFDLDYGHVSLGLEKAQMAATFGVERLEGEGGNGFGTPLATLHAFNGFADVFLGTPPRGLWDTYLKVAWKPGKGVSAAIIYHDFQSSDRALDYGKEWDGVVTWRINPQWTLTAKAALYDGAANAPYGKNADVEKFWIQSDFSY